MKITFKMLDQDELKEILPEDHPERDMLRYDTYVNAVCKFVDGKFSHVLAWDGGEPEDNCFNRDGGWITPALNEAYEAGYAQGREDGVNGSVDLGL